MVTQHRAALSPRPVEEINSYLGVEGAVDLGQGNLTSRKRLPRLKPYVAILAYGFEIALQATIPDAVLLHEHP